MPATTGFAAVVRGMVAGAVGTAAMTLSETVEMTLTGRKGSNVPGQVGAHLLPGRDPDSPADVERLNTATHWAHGIGMGALRGALDLAGVRGPQATAAHFALLWGWRRGALQRPRHRRRPMEVGTVRACHRHVSQGRVRRSHRRRLRPTHRNDT
jgi:hypothetical protein